MIKTAAVGLMLAILPVQDKAPEVGRIQVQCLKGVCLIEMELYKARVESHNARATTPPAKCPAMLKNET